MSDFYKDKLALLKEILVGNDFALLPDRLIVDGTSYPIVEDVIVMLDRSRYTGSLKRRLGLAAQERAPAADSPAFAEDIQSTFGAEWTRHAQILPEYSRVFREYFDLIDVDALGDKRVCDLGCGTGRWSHMLRGRCREQVLVDFSDAIFVARRNMGEAANAVFIMADIKHLPFRHDAFDLLFSLGVLHHLPTDALDEVRALKPYAPDILVYLYYALDNKPAHFRLALAPVTAVRRVVSRVRNKAFREAFCWFAAATLYAPLVGIGHALKPFGVSGHVPLYAEHHYMTFRWWRLLAYDRFFTRIEQRVSRAQIAGLRDTFGEVGISPNSAYWHFLCRR